MNDVLVVEVINRLEYLLDRLRGVLFCELALITNSVKQLSTRRQLRHDVVFVLFLSAQLGWLVWINAHS